MRRPPDNLLELFEIGAADLAASEPAGPRLAVAAAPLFRFGPSEPARLDSRRSSAVDGGPRVAPVPPQTSRLGLLSSLAVHLLPLLALLDWRFAPAELARPIPVQLVIEQPSPPPKPVAKAEEPKRAPPTRRASAEIGETDPKPGQPGSAAENKAEPPPETQMAALAPPRPPPVLESALPKPAPSPDAIAIPDPSKPPPLPQPPIKQTVATRLPPRPHASPRKAELQGPAATYDEYLARCQSLIERNLETLASFIAGRRGVMVLNLFVLGDGTISRVMIARGSGFPDIDSRAQAMIVAVRHFPPVPQWFQGPVLPLEFTFPFPEGLHR